MTEIEKIERAIAALEAQRAVLDDAVVETALASLREKLASLRARRPPADAQRKQVTVLFADVSGFTAISETMDAEDVTATLNALWRRLDAAITAHGGTIDKHIGDAVMALWGVETVREDDPERAIRAALAIQAEVRPFASTTRYQLQMRVGLHTGPVLLGEVGTTGEFTAMGDTVNLASRLEHAAPAGSILISYDTYRHVRGMFEVRALGPIAVKGKSEPVRAYLVEGAKPRAFRVGTRGVEGVETRMVGREAELRQLQAAFEVALRNSTTQLVTVIGEAGLGKSRLLYEFSNWLDLLPADVWHFKGRASLQTSNLPYALLRDLFAFRFELLESDSAATVRDKLEQGIAQFAHAPGAGTEATEDSQTKAHFLGAWLGYDFSSSPRLAGVRNDPRQLRDRALKYLVEFFTAAACTSPTVVLLEDVHWADDQSLEALEYLVRQCPNLRLLVLCLARPTLFERRAALGQGLPCSTCIELHPLSTSDSRRLAEEILQKVDAAPPDLYDLIVERSEGNPFYVEELIKMLIDDRVIVTATDPWRVETHRAAGLRVPSTLVGVLQARLDSLGSVEKVTLQRASVVGRTFWESAVAFLSAGGEAAGFTAPAIQGALLRALATLRARELVFPHIPSTFEGTPEYLFKHALLRDVAYDSVLKRERPAYHRRAAQWLETVTQRGGRMDEYAALIAQHYEQAGDVAQAMEWYERAGTQAATQFANADAVRCFSRVLELSPAMDDVRRYRVLLAREKVYDLQGARQTQSQDLDALAELAERLNDNWRRVEVALRRAHYAIMTGDYVGAVAASQQTVALARAAGVADGEAEGYLEWGRALMRQADYAAARVQLERALELAHTTHLPRVEADSLLGLGIIHYDQGDYERATTCYEQALRLHRQLGTRRGESAALVNLGVVAVTQADYVGARTDYEQALRLKREIGDRRGEGSTLANLGNVAFQQGDYAAARAYLEQGLHISREVGDRYSESNALNNLGDVGLTQGDYATARGYFEQALCLYRETGHRYGETYALMGLSLLLHHLGDDEAAREHSHLALRIARDAGIQPVQARALTNLGHILSKLGHLEEAANAYREALSLRRELGEPNLAMEPIAGLARVSLANGDLAQARARVDEILDHLETGTLDGAAEPFSVYLTCYRVLRAVEDSRADRVLNSAHTRLQEQAARLGDQALQRSFLDHVPAHRELVAEWKARHGA